MTQATIAEPELDEYCRQFHAAKMDARELAGELTEAQLTWRPKPDRWSIAECLAHLNLAGQQYMRSIGESIHKARAQKLYGHGPFHYGTCAGLLIRVLEPPAAQKMQTPPSLQPAVSEPAGKVLKAFLHLQDELRERLKQSCGLDLKRATAVSGISRLLKLSLGVVFATAAAHQRRHLWQAREVRNHPDFPNA